MISTRFGTLSWYTGYMVVYTCYTMTLTSHINILLLFPNFLPNCKFISYLCAPVDIT